MNMNALSRVRAAYPAEAKAKGAEGTVIVMIRVDEAGNVSAVQACSGHPLLLQSTEEAARRERFRPTILEGKAVKVGGVLSYTFRLDEAEGRLSERGRA